MDITRRVLAILTIVSSLEAANILGVFYYPDYSHSIVHQSLIEALSDRGHHLTILTAVPFQRKHPNVTEIFMENSHENSFNFVESRGVSAVLLAFQCVQKIFATIDKQLQQPKVRELIDGHENYHFDLIILEYGFTTPYISFAEIYDAPVIATFPQVSFKVHKL